MKKIKKILKWVGLGILLVALFFAVFVQFRKGEFLSAVVLLAMGSGAYYFLGPYSKKLQEPQEEKELSVLEKEKERRKGIRISRIILGILVGVAFFGLIHSFVYGDIGAVDDTYEEWKKQKELEALKQIDTIKSLEEFDKLYENGLLDDIDMYIIDSLDCNCPGMDSTKFIGPDSL